WLSCVSMGPIDVLVCNQGVFVSHKLEKQEINEVKDMTDVNLVETFNVVKAALPGMKNRSDRKPVSIVFMSWPVRQANSVVLQSDQVMDNSEFYAYRPKVKSSMFTYPL
ncbi:3-dehydrosphinganine reductase TSC10A-like protein, partial [Tanacetum coccineum]